ncbi:MAG: glycosyltransferase family 2 protein [Planctomycetota bacterium]
MKVSVITVCFNPGPALADCVASVRRQDYPNVEHWIVDGGSTDGTVARLEQLAAEDDKLRWVSEPDEGLYDAINKGLARASGDVVGLLHADDFYASHDVISDVMEAMADPAVDACYADLMYVDAEDTTIVKRNWKSEPFRPGMFLNGWLPPHPTFYARKRVYEELGSFDTQFRIGADWDLLLRFMEVHQIRTRYVPHTWVKMRVGGVSNRSLKNMWHNHQECLRAFKKYGIKPKPWFVVTKYLHRLKTVLRGRATGTSP